MGFFDEPFGKLNEQHAAAEHAVLVYFAYGSNDLSSLFALEEQLERVISAAEVGVFDRHEIPTDGSDGILYMYGPDVDALFAAVRPTLDAAAFMKGAIDFARLITDRTAR
jgi:hypothetical protein